MKPTFEFLVARVPLTWRDVQFGLEREIIGEQVAVELAMAQVVEQEDPSDSLLELAAASADYPPIRSIVLSLADLEDEQPAEGLLRRWLYLSLAWLYEVRREVRDPLGKVEEIYADFGYPGEIEPFVRYMPMAGPDLGSEEANVRRLFERWKAYIDERALDYRV